MPNRHAYIQARLLCDVCRRTSGCRHVACQAHTDSRRAFVAALIAAPALILASPAQSQQLGKLDLPNKEVDDSSSAFIQVRHAMHLP